MTSSCVTSFPNYWHHYPEGFEDFAALVKELGLVWRFKHLMMVAPHKKLSMFCLENRFRELYWSGLVSRYGVSY